MMKSSLEVASPEASTIASRKVFTGPIMARLHLRLPIGFVGQIPRLTSSKNVGSTCIQIFEVGTLERNDAYRGYSVGSAFRLRTAPEHVLAALRTLVELLGTDLDIASFTSIELTT